MNTSEIILIVSVSVVFGFALGLIVGVKAIPDNRIRAMKCYQAIQDIEKCEMILGINPK